MRVRTSPTIVQVDEAVAEREEQSQQEELELDAMTEPDEESRSSAGTPLLHPERNYGSGPHSPLFTRNDGERNDPEDVVESSGPQGLGTWFVWALTLSAGISGLLFGYECVL